MPKIVVCLRSARSSAEGCVKGTICKELDTHIGVSFVAVVRCVDSRTVQECVQSVTISRLDNNVAAKQACTAVFWLGQWVVADIADHSSNGTGLIVVSTVGRTC